MSDKTILLVALAVITLGVPELRDAEGHITRDSTLRNVLPGEPFTLTSEEDAEALKAAGHARDPNADEAEANAEATKPAAKPRAKRAAAAEQGGQADQGAQAQADADPATAATSGSGEPAATGEAQA